MHVNSIKAFAAKTAADTVFGGKDAKVVVKATLPGPGPKGISVYIGRLGKFSESKKEDAHVFHYDTDRVGEQLFECLLNGMAIEVEAA